MINIKHYDVVLSPVITEKTTLINEQNKVVFNVSLKATKFQIKAAVQSLFGVTVVGVNTLVSKGKKKRFRGTVGHQSDTKKAIVTLLDGQSIDVSIGI
jgi:large subunit ribosomal protein L23